MAKTNYSAWKINPADFSEKWPPLKKLQFFARYAILAPSGHNTQPWHFLSSGDEILLKPNPSRHLPYSGTAAAEPHISLGCCLETLALAAKGFGYEIAVKSELDTVTRIALGKKITPEPSLLEAIISRVSNRNVYAAKPLDVGLLKSLVAHSFNNASLQAVTDKDEIDFIAQQTSLATVAIMSDAAFRLELSKWVRNNVTRQHDGMPGHVQGMPTPPSLIARHVIKNIDISKGQAKTDSKRVLNSPALLVVRVKDIGDEEFLNSGRLYARVCILAQQAGLNTSGVGAAVIDLDTRELIKQKLKLPDQPIAIIRLGKASKSARHTPRWPLEKVLD